MFGLNEALMSFIRRQVGLRTDAASATGSAHARLAYIAANTGIKSIQRGTIALGTSDTTKAATISAVTTGKAMVNLLGVSAPSVDNWVTSQPYGWAYTAHFGVRLALTNGTTVTATRAAHHNAAATVSYEVIEFV